VIYTRSSETRQGWYWWQDQPHWRIKVALKHLRAPDPSKFQKRFDREHTIWATLDHPNVLPFLGTAELGPGVCFVSPWMDNGNVMDYIARHPKVDREVLVKGIAAGMQYLHEQTPSLVHGDIKGRNVLVDEFGTTLLCDFGLALHEDLERATTTLAGLGTARWMAPERLSPDAFRLTTSKTRTTSADVFSFAMTAYEIISEEVPFADKSDWDAVFAIVDGIRPLIPLKWGGSTCAEVIEACWKQDRAKRPSARQIVDRLSGRHIQPCQIT